jgi:hypothetical protein
MFVSKANGFNHWSALYYCNLLLLLLLLLLFITMRIPRLKPWVMFEVRIELERAFHYK